MGNDKRGFSVTDPFGDENKPGRAYDQDKDRGISQRGERYTPTRSEQSDIYKEYMRQYEQKKQGTSAAEEREPMRKDRPKKPVKQRDAEREESIDLSVYSVKAKRKKKKNRKKKAIIISACAALVILGVLAYLIVPFLNYHHKEISKKPKDLGFKKVINEKIVNIALFGIDTREPDCFEGLSDSIMILSLNTETKKVKVISLMRDTIIRIDNKGDVYYSKLNSAYATGGPELAIKTINQNFGLDISNYATINFYGMVDIIDAVGGINATITEDELEWKGNDNPNLNNCMEEICDAKGLDLNNYLIHSAGEQHLNGVQAVAYSRVRHCLSVFGTNDDFGRTDRQRHVMQELFSKAVTLKKSQYYGLAKALLPCSETSLDLDEILSLAFDILLEHPAFEQYRVPQTEWLMPFNYQSYGSCVYFDMEYAKNAIHAIIYDGLTVEQYVEKNPIQKNDWFASIGVKTYDDSGEVPEWSQNPETPETPSQSTPSDGDDEGTDDDEGGDGGGTDDDGGDTEENV